MSSVRSMGLRTALFAVTRRAAREPELASRSDNSELATQAGQSQPNIPAVSRPYTMPSTTCFPTADHEWSNHTP